MKKYNVITKELLIKEYIKNKNSVYKIAEIIGCTHMTVWNRIVQYGIPTRNKTDGYSGKGNPNYGKKHPGMNKGIKRSDATRKKLSLAKKGMYIGKNNPHFGKPVSPKWGKYKNINMRSNWEIKYAKYLDENNIKWLYESKRFDLGNTTYTPDFYLPKTNEYIEIKGYFPDKCKKKLNKFRVLYPKENFSILQGKELSNLGIKIEERFKK